MAAGLHALGALGALSLLASEVPRMSAWPLAAASVAYGVVLGRAELRQPVRQLVWTAGATPTVDGQSMAEPQLHWRGPLAFLRWRDVDGRLQRLAWWPDVLSAAARRELRLAAMDAAGAAPAASMAP